MACGSSVPSIDGADPIFHEAYDRARAESEGNAPLLIVMPGELALHLRGARRSFAYPHPPFHAAKAAAHVAVALYTLTGPSEDGSLPLARASRLESITTHLESTLERLTVAEAKPDGLERELLPLVMAALAFGERALRHSRLPTPGREEFARASGLLILRVTELATCGQIGALHGAFELALRELSGADREKLQVVVIGDHQARSRSLAMQYFCRRLGEAEGADERVTYGENIESEAEAITLFGTRRLDCAIARAFFADEKRLQRDVLGDAAKSCLDRMELAPIPGAG